MSRLSRAYVEQVVRDRFIEIGEGLPFEQAFIDQVVNDLLSGQIIIIQRK